jgi:hypothetical protein
MLTSAFVHDPSLRQQLQAAIRQAANAEAGGIPGAQAMAIERLINGIEQGIGRGVTTADGRTLQTLARMWLGQTPSTR